MRTQSPNERQLHTTKNLEGTKRTLLDTSSHNQSRIAGRSSDEKAGRVHKVPAFRHWPQPLLCRHNVRCVPALGRAKHLVALLVLGCAAIGERRGSLQDNTGEL
jgi:hypothetical protein